MFPARQQRRNTSIIGSSATVLYLLFGALPVQAIRRHEIKPRILDADSRKGMAGPEMMCQARGATDHRFHNNRSLST